jgi:hypothetical protein
MRGYTLEQLWEMDHHGTVEYEGKVFLLMQDAYCDSDFSQGTQLTAWKAHAIDREGNDFLVMWYPVEGYERFEDESDCCDWRKPYIVEER